MRGGLCSFFFIINRLDPSNTRAREGIERVEKQGDMGADNAFDVEVEEMENSENEVRTKNLSFKCSVAKIHCNITVMISLYW